MIVMNNEEVSWSYKKIAIGVIVVGILALIVYSQRDHIASYKTPQKEVAGIETTRQKQSSETKVTIPKVDLQEKITDITEQISKLDVGEVAASSPQVQKVLKDMESLKDVPRSQAKDACMSICRSL